MRWISKQSEAVGKIYSISDEQHNKHHVGRAPHEDGCDYRPMTANPEQRRLVARYENTIIFGYAVTDDRNGPFSLVFHIEGIFGNVVLNTREWDVQDASRPAPATSSDPQNESKFDVPATEDDEPAPSPTVTPDRELVGEAIRSAMGCERRAHYGNVEQPFCGKHGGYGQWPCRESSEVFDAVLAALSPAGTSGEGSHEAD